MCETFASSPRPMSSDRSRKMGGLSGQWGIPGRTVTDTSIQASDRVGRALRLSAAESGGMLTIDPSKTDVTAGDGAPAPPWHPDHGDHASPPTGGSAEPRAQ